MRRIIVTEELSLDGVMEDPTWASPYWDDEVSAFKSEESYAADTLLMGRLTYDSLAGFWPTSTDEGADRMNSLRKYVVSKTLSKADWNNTLIIRDNVVDEIRALKQQEGQDILVYGSGALAQTLIQHDLVDSYRLLICPVVVGKGKRLFKDGTAATLTLAEAKSFRSGVVAMIYQRATS
jgi:dihydrofolate reductase